jgi:hypothetical protein
MVGALLLSVLFFVMFFVAKMPNWQKEITYYISSLLKHINELRFGIYNLAMHFKTLCVYKISQDLGNFYIKNIHDVFNRA